MSRFFMRLALSAGVCVSLADATPAAEQEITARPLPSAAQARILAALDQPTEFDFQGRTLSDVMKHFEQQHKIAILLDGKAISDARVDTDKPITLALRQISLRSALRLLLRPFDLTYVVHDGYVMITSMDEAENMLSFKVYPVRDLVTLDTEFRTARLIRDSFPALSRSGTSAPLSALTDSAEEDFENLIAVIMSSLAPTSWDEVGGPGTISGNRNTQAIAVYQTEEIHQELVVLLAALRRVRDEQLAAAQPLATAPDPPKKKEPVEVRGYRLMRAPKTPGKSGWRQPLGVVGDSTPPREPQTNVRKSEAPSEPAGAQGGTAISAPPKETAPAKEATPADKPVPAHPDVRLEAWIEAIAKVVPEIIEPQSWAPSGEGMIRAVGEGIVVRNTPDVQRRVARLMAELLPDYVPVDFVGPWGPWGVALRADHAAVRLRPATTDNWPHEPSPRPSHQEVRVREALLEKCDVDFDGVPLIDALAWLADRRHAQLYIDHKALSDTGANGPVTHSVRGISYEAALRLLLDQLDLTYVIHDEVLLVTSKTEAENLLTTKVYPVFDLVVRRTDASTSRPGLDFESLVESLTTSIAPTSWDQVGGPGAIQPFTNSGALVISQTSDVHRKVVEYLRALREVGAAQKEQRADANP